MSIAALCAHFDEGEILISRALRELEAAGYLERRRVRTPTGQVRTRTYFYDVPGGAPDGGPPEPPKPPRPRKASAAEEATPSPAREQPEKPESLSDADPRAVAVLVSLRRVDPRLVLSEQEAVRLAPAVARWLAAGVDPSQITALLTARLPDRFLTRPAGILAFRLRETPLPAPPPRRPRAGARVLPGMPLQGIPGSSPFGWLSRLFRANCPIAPVTSIMCGREPVVK